MRKRFAGLVSARAICRTSNLKISGIWEEARAGPGLASLNGKWSKEQRNTIESVMGC